MEQNVTGSPGRCANSGPTRVGFFCFYFYVLQRGGIFGVFQVFFDNNAFRASEMIFGEFLTKGTLI